MNENTNLIDEHNEGLTPIEQLSPFKRIVLSLGTLPSAFYDTMTYYESLVYFYEYLKNEVIPTVNNNGEAVEELQTKYLELKDYVDNYFENLDVQEEINQKLDEMALDGTLTNLIKDYVDPIYQAYETEINGEIRDQNTEITNFKNSINTTVHAINNKVDSLYNGTPLTASSTSEMTDTSKIYVNTTDGKWYYYDGTNWTIGGTYQSTGIGENTITYNNLDPRLQDDFQENINLLVLNPITSNTYLTTSGEEFTASGYSTTAFIEVDATRTIYIKQLPDIRIAEYDDSKTFITYYEGVGSIIPNASTKYIKYAFPSNELLNVFICYENIKNSIIRTPYLLDGTKLNNNSIDNKSINNIDIEKINEVEILSHNLFNKDRPYEINKYLNGNTGIPFEINGYIATDYIALEPSTEYSCNMEKVCLYDKDFNFIRQNDFDYVNNINNFTTSNIECYYRGCFAVSELNDRVMNKGSSLYNWDQYKYTFNNLAKTVINNYIKSNNIAGILHDNATTTKIVTVGDSITAGSGGTGYNENGSEIGTTGYHRNETGYCWANLLKQNLESKFNCTVTNNGISGINSSYVASHLSDLIPTDTDIAIVMVGTNDRINSTTYNSLYANLTAINTYCENNNIKLIPMCSCPASVTDEERENGTFNVRYKHMEDISNTISAFAINNDLQYIDLFEKFYMFAFTKGVPITNYLADGLHPNDQGYYLMFRLISHEIGIDAKIENATWN